MLRFLTAGESHGPAILAILDGMPAGLPLTQENIQPDLARRQKGYGVGPRMKGIEKDRAEILGGVLAGETTGAPIGLLIRNRDHEKWVDRAVDPVTTPRPGHVDLSAAIKFGYRDLRFGSERASARETAPRVAVGAICRHLLAQFGMVVGSYVTGIGSARADLSGIPLEERIERAEGNEVRCPSPEGAQAMEDEIEAAMQAKDTVGGTFDVVALGVPPGLGRHTQWDKRLESRLAEALMSIQAIKGVGIGGGFDLARMWGTVGQDGIRLEGSRLRRTSNQAGGIEGGISNGEPIVTSAAMKPISSTLTPQPSVDLHKGEQTETRYERSDFCAVPRAAVVGEAMVAYVLADAFLEKLGGDHLHELLARYETLRQARLEDISIEGKPIKFWQGDGKRD